MFVSKKWHGADCIKYKVMSRNATQNLRFYYLECHKGKLFVSNKWHGADCIKYKIWVEMPHKKSQKIYYVECHKGKLFVSNKWHGADCIKYKIWVEISTQMVSDFIM